jgi:hypothetical protein
LGSLLPDGAAAPTGGCTVIGASIYSRCNINLPLGLFDLSAANPFELMLGGGSNADSYFTYGGARFAPGISPPVIPPPQGTSVPEPSALLVFGSMLPGFYAMFRRKKSKAALKA